MYGLSATAPVINVNDPNFGVLGNPNGIVPGQALPPTQPFTPCTCVNGTCLEDGNSCSSSYAPYTGDAAIYCEPTSPQYNVNTCNNLYAAVPSVTSSITAWLNANSTLAIAGAVGLLLVFSMSGGRRR